MHRLAYLYAMLARTKCICKRWAIACHNGWRHLNNSIGRTLVGQCFAVLIHRRFIRRLIAIHTEYYTSYLTFRVNATAYFMFPRGIKGRANSLVDTLLPMRSSWINVSGKCIHATVFPYYVDDFGACELTKRCVCTSQVQVQMQTAIRVIREKTQRFRRHFH